MAKNVLATNFQDDILNSSMNGKRRYNLIPNSDGTYSLEDVTEYDQVGSDLGAGQINAITTAVNESADKNKVIQSLEDISAVTEDNYIAGALAVGELNRSLKGFSPVLDETTGEITGYTTEIGGADTVFPFKSGGSIIQLSEATSSISVNVADYYDGDLSELTVDNFICDLQSCIASSAGGTISSSSSYGSPWASATSNMSKSYDASTGIFKANITSTTSKGQTGAVNLCAPGGSFKNYYGQYTVSSSGTFIPYLVIR